MIIGTIIGLILLLIPFILISRFKDKNQGLFYLLTGIILFSLFIALISQALHIFRYNVILVIFILLDILIVGYCYQRDQGFKELINRIRIKSIKIDWMLLIVIVIVFICLYSVHYNYSGKITTVTEPLKEVNNARLTYPYYSDEWGSVSVIKNAIETKRLPFANPLMKNSFYPNFGFATHSFLSLFFVLLKLDVLSYYSIFSLFFGILICVLVYLLLRVNAVGKIPAGIAAMLVPYITNGVNLPGIWYLLPVIFGIICFLLGLIFMSINDKKMSLLLGFLTLIFYPPLFVFYSISILSYFIIKLDGKEKRKYIGIFLGICFCVAFIIFLFLFIIKGYNYAINLILEKLYYPSFTKNAIPDYSIWKVLPIPILILSIIGLLTNYKKKIFLLPVIVGLIYWLIYSKILFRIIIEYQRVVLITSILLIIFAGFGLNSIFLYFKDYGKTNSNLKVGEIALQSTVFPSSPNPKHKSEGFGDKKYFKEYHLLFIMQVIIIAVLLLFSFNYTKMNNWQELKLHTLDNDKYVSPNSAATSYLTEDDLRIFKNIKDKTFISLPWKALVIGAATGNYPLETKPSIISVKLISYDEFYNSKCEDKLKTIKKFKVDYVYFPFINCTEGFELIDKSNEGLYLYKVGD